MNERDYAVERQRDRATALVEVERLARRHGKQKSCTGKPRDLMAARRAAFAVGCSSREVGEATARGWAGGGEDRDGKTSA